MMEEVSTGHYEVKFHEEKKRKLEKFENNDNNDNNLKKKPKSERVSVYTRAYDRLMKIVIEESKNPKYLGKWEEKEEKEEEKEEKE